MLLRSGLRSHASSRPLINTTSRIFSSSASSSAPGAPAPRPGSWEADYAATHVPTSPLQKAFLFGASSLLTLINTHRGDLLSTVGETFVPEPALARLRTRMMKSEEGAEILRTKPRVLDVTRAHFAASRASPAPTDASTAAAAAPEPVVLTVEMEREWLTALLAQSPTTFGHHYARYMLSHGYTPSARTPVRYIDDPELAYIMQRYREVHDFLHVLTDIPPSVEGELALKALEFHQTGLPLAAAAVAVAGPARLRAGGARELFTNALPWATRVSESIDAHTAGAGALAVPYEQWLGDEIDVLRRIVGINEPYVSASST